MSFCLGVYPDGTQLGPAAGGPSSFITQPGLPVAYAKSGVACSGSEVEVYTKAEVDAVASGSGGTPSLGFPEIFSLTPDQGVQIAGAVLLLWGVAFCFRLLARQLMESEVGTSTSDE